MIGIDQYFPCFSFSIGRILGLAILKSIVGSTKKSRPRRTTREKDAENQHDDDSAQQGLAADLLEADKDLDLPNDDPIRVKMASFLRLSWRVVLPLIPPTALDSGSVHVRL